MTILESKYGNDGYAFWFKILELLGSNEGHYYDCNNPENWEYLLSYTHLEEETALKIFQTLSVLDAIDPELWEEKIIWSQNFVDNLTPLYSKRVVEIPQKPSFRNGNTHGEGHSSNGNPQSKVEKSKVEKSKEKERKEKNLYVPKKDENTEETAQKILDYLNQQRKRKLGKQHPFISLHPHLLARIKEGCTLDDAKLVIDWKIHQWGEDAEMEQYLNLETLFRKTKFPRYLIEAKENKEKITKEEYAKYKEKLWKEFNDDLKNIKNEQEVNQLRKEYKNKMMSFEEWKNGGKDRET